MRKLLPFLAIGLILRVFLMLFTYHPDLAGQSLSAYFWGFENVTNVYEHLLSLPTTHPLVKNFGVSDIFIYPPLTYFTLGTFQKLFASLFDLRGFLDSLMNATPLTSISNFPIFLFLIKLPYLFFDVLLGFLIYRLFSKNSRQFLITLVWIFNPINLYATYCMGVFDIIPVTFCFLSLYLFEKKHLYYSALSLGVGAAYKMFPIFLLPFLIFLPRLKLIDRIKILLIGLLPLLLTNLPFIFSSAYRYMVFSPKSQKMLYLIFPLTAAEGIYPFILLFTLLILILVHKKESVIQLFHYYLIFFLLLFSLTHYHPQWFLWISPFIIVDIFRSQFRHLWLHLCLVFIYFFIVFTFDNSLSIGLFYPLIPELKNFVGIDNILTSILDLNHLKSLARSVFAAISLYLSYSLLK